MTQEGAKHAQSGLESDVKSCETDGDEKKTVTLSLHVYNDDKESNDIVTTQFSIESKQNGMMSGMNQIEKVIESCLKNSKYLKSNQWSMLKKEWKLSNESNESNENTKSITLQLKKSVTFDKTFTTFMESLLEKRASNDDNDVSLSLYLLPSQYKDKAPSSRKESHLQKYDLIPVKIGLNDEKMNQLLSINGNENNNKQFTKYHKSRLEQLKECINEGYFEMKNNNDNDNDNDSDNSKKRKEKEFYNKCVLKYFNDLLYQLWQSFLILFYDSNVECNLDNFYNNLLYYIGFCDVKSNLYVIPQLKLSNGCSRGDIAVGSLASTSNLNLSINCDNDEKKFENENDKSNENEILNRLYLFMEDKSLQWSNDEKNENQFGNVTSQLIFGAIEAIDFRKQFNQNVFLFRNLGGKITIYIINISSKMYEKIRDKSSNIEKGFWKKENGDYPIYQIDYQFDIFERKNDFLQFVDILEKLFLLFAPVSHPKVFVNDELNQLTDEFDQLAIDA